MSTLKELVDEVDDTDVYHAFRKQYPRLSDEAIGDHIDVLHKLRAMTPKPHDTEDGDPIEAIVVKAIHGKGTEIYKAYVWYDVGGVARSGQTWAIEFVRWEHWLTWPVRPVGCDLQPAELLAHCLYEMTFCGFSQMDVAEGLAVIHERVDELKAMIDDEEDGA